MTPLDTLRRALERECCEKLGLVEHWAVVTPQRRSPWEKREDAERVAAAWREEGTFGQPVEVVSACPHISDPSAFPLVVEALAQRGLGLAYIQRRNGPGWRAWLFNGYLAGGKLRAGEEALYVHGKSAIGAAPEVAVLEAIREAEL